MTNELRVVAIDDSPTVHNFLRRYLSTTEPTCVLTGFPNGAVALEAMRKTPAMADLILLDWEMPQMDGPTTFAGLREAGVKTPVIMLTSKSEVADIEQMLAAGVDEYVIKPFTADLILEKISQVLGRPVVGHGG